VRDNYEWNNLDKDPNVAPLLGTMPDPQLAEKLGIKEHRIRQARNKLGIPAFYEEMYIYGEWTPENLAKLGKMSDNALAKLMGISSSSVSKKRQSLEIAPLGIKKKTGNLGVDWDQWKHLLGTMRDSELAEKIGVTLRMVCHARNKCGIAPYKKPFKKPSF